MALMVQRAIQVQLGPLETQGHPVFKACREKEELQELLDPRVTEVASERKVQKEQLEMMAQGVFQVLWDHQVLQALLEKRVNLVLEV